MNRTRILLAFLALAVTLGVWRWLFAEPSITLNVKDAPLSKVLKEFERQGHIKLVSNLDPAKKITLFFDKTPVFDALETLSIRADASWRLAYLAAPKNAQIDAVLTAFTNQDTSPPAWNSYQLRGGGGGGGWGNSDAPGDPRIVAWPVTPSDSKDLASYFAQAAQKTPASFAVAPDWNPILGKVPKSGPLEKSVPKLVSQAGGTVREVFLLEGRPNFRPEAEGTAPAAGGPEGPPVDWSNRGPQRSTFVNALRREQTNPEWMAQRAEDTIKQLPPDQQVQARQDLQDMRNFMEEMRKLSPEERRAKMEEAMNDPKIAERMEARAASRDSRMGPTQRAERSKRYVKNKVEAREKAGNPMTPKN